MSEPDTSTQFQPGNQAWRARSSHGRNPKFETPDILEAACIEYFEWSASSPLYAVELVKYQGQATQVEVPRMRAMTLAALCNYIGLSCQGWREYRQKADFSAVCEWVENIIYCHKFEGAAADLLNPAIIARELGLADKRESELDVPEPVTSIIYRTVDARIPDHTEHRS